uniref:Phytocyanin domain-containing protein n=1 Tax=Salix viminalis TaxID=40686 RepID=A0A6N2MMF1_SALVM
MEATKNNSIKTMVMERKQEEMQFLGVLGIYQEAYKIIFSSTKIFSQITLALILPLSFILLAQIEVSNVFSGEIMNNFVELLGTEAGTERYNKISDHISSEFAYFWLFKVAHLILSLVFSLLSNAAVVYTIASIYAGREVSFKKVMSAVPKRWMFRQNTTFTLLPPFLHSATKNSIKTMVMERKQEEMQFLGVFGIFQEAYKIIFSCRKIFSQITLALILPLSFIFLAQIEVSNVLFGEIINNEVELQGIEAGTKRYNKLSDHISSEFAYFCFFKVAYLILSVVFSLLSTAAVVYTIAVFTYDPTIHNVVAVNRGGYSSCITPAGARVYKSGNDQIKLSKGQNFFICNVAEHCESGMKIAINAA